MAVRSTAIFNFARNLRIREKRNGPSKRSETQVIEGHPKKKLNISGGTEGIGIGLLIMIVYFQAI